MKTIETGKKTKKNNCIAIWKSPSDPQNTHYYSRVTTNSAKLIADIAIFKIKFK